MSMMTAFSVSKNGFFEGWRALHARSKSACQAKHSAVCAVCCLHCTVTSLRY